MQLTRIFRSASHDASECVKFTTPPLAAPYTASWRCGYRPAIEAVLMMTPPPFFCISGAARPVAENHCLQIDFDHQMPSLGRRVGIAGSADADAGRCLCRMSRRPNFETAVSSIRRRVLESGDVGLHEDRATAGALDALDGFGAAASSRSATTIAALLLPIAPQLHARFPMSHR